MIGLTSDSISKKLAFQYILDNIDFRKRSLYLQEIIALGKENKIWKQAILSFFDTPYVTNPSPSKN